jgi:DNA replication protein DnaC
MSCPRCSDTGFVAIEPGHVVSCQCRQERLRVAALARAGIPPLYQRKGFAEYDTSVSRSAAGALTMAKRYVEEWPTQPGTGMLLVGPLGVGKTHLTCAILKECASRYNARVVFADLAELLDRIRASYDSGTPETEAKILRPIFEADILAIDEIGRARVTDWAFATTENLLNQRYNGGRSTLLTTNYPNHPSGYAPPKPARVGGAVDFATVAGSGPTVMPLRSETLGDRIGDRMWSRVQEMCVVVEMDGPDQRLQAARRRG